MQRRLLLSFLLLLPTLTVAADPPAKKPNVILILADDLGYGDLGCYGQKRIRTPNLDQLAKDGMRFTACYAGATVCAPSRCSLMTGLHGGHARIRGNGGLVDGKKGQVPLAATDRTVAEMFQTAGYRTALIGKWGLGEADTTGVPNKKGFDVFYGYLNQTHAHNYYPDFLWRNDKKEGIAENVQREGVKGVADKPVKYAPDLLLAEAEKFLDDNKAKPFFLYYASIVPHANNERTKADKNGMEVPSDAPYTKEEWPQAEKNKAAMITRLDADVGKLLAKLKELKLDENTVVLFSSDNGPHKEGGNDPAFFASSGPYSGIKRSLTDGGIRVPLLVRWPGVVAAGSKSEHDCAFWDFLPTACEMVGQPVPEKLDGISLMPTLTGKGHQDEHEWLYWEFHEGGFVQAVKFEDWKAIRPWGQPIRLYDLVDDPGEKKDVAGKFPELLKKAEDGFDLMRSESKEYPLPEKK